MQYVWANRLWPTSRLTSTTGQRIEVIDPGQLNKAAGPDFFNAKIKIDGAMWAGNVEMHVRSSDWYRHGHQHDAMYDNVILHVVRYADMDVPLHDVPLPQVLMACNPLLNKAFDELKANEGRGLPCASILASIPPVHRTDWLTALGFERLQSKSDRVRSILANDGGDWFAAAYVTLARALGYGSNGENMERLARAVPAKALIAESGREGGSEAILLGMAGLLDTLHPRDQYEEYLATEYTFLERKYNLAANLSEPLLWQRKVRPLNSPLRRVAALALIMGDAYAFTARLFGITGAEDCHGLFNFPSENYWTTHTTFGHPADRPQPVLSRSSIDLLAINAIAPLLYARGEEEGDDRLRDTALDILQSLKPEENRIVATFRDAGIECDDAFTSQAIIQLHTQYCTRRKCLECRWGRRYLSHAAPDPEAK